MKVHQPIALLVLACQAHHRPVAAIGIQRFFNFQENNYLARSPKTDGFMMANVAGTAPTEDSSDSASASYHETPVGQGAGKGKGGRASQNGGGSDKDKKCCACTCYDTNDYSGESRVYKQEYDSQSIDGEDYCHCSCSCGSKITMPIIPTVPPPSPPPVEPSQSPVAPVPFPTTRPTNSPTISPVVAPSAAPTVPEPIPTRPTDSPTASPTASPTPSPTASPTETPTQMPPPTVCAIPSQPPLKNELEEVISECAVGGRTMETNNTLIRLLDDVKCSGDASTTAFLEIIGDNNTVDCGGFSIMNSGFYVRGLSFQGSNNLVRNCPNISGFNIGIVVDGGSAHIFSVTVSDNSAGLVVQGGEAYVDASVFSGNIQGIAAAGFNTTATGGPLPFKLTVTNSTMTGNEQSGNGIGTVLQGFGEACLEGNDISGNDVNVVIFENSFGTPAVTMVDTNACDSVSVADISDNTDIGTTTLIDTTCTSVKDRFDGSGNDLDSTLYGCTPCPTPSPTESPTSSPTEMTASPTASPTVFPTESPTRVCEYPLLLPTEYEGVENVTECTAEGRTLEMNNTLIQLQANIECTGGDSSPFFLQITGDNNTVDCGGYRVVNSAMYVNGFVFTGSNNVLQNCPEVSGFNITAAIFVNEGSVRVFNVTATHNSAGLFISNGAVFVDGSNFLMNGNGVTASGNIATQFKLVITNSNITGSDIYGVSLQGTAGEACFDGNDFAANDINIAILIPVSPIVALSDTNACNSTSGTDIIDLLAVTTVLTGVQCETVFGGTSNASEYGCEPCE